MASSSPYVFPQEGLNYLLGIVPKGTYTTPTNTYVGLFTTPWSTITAFGYTNTNINLNTTPNQVSELVNPNSPSNGYARIALPSGTWAATTSGQVTIGANTVWVQQTVGSGVLFTCTSGTWSNIYGIFVATWGTTGGASNGTTNSVLWYAPFADLNPVTLSSGDSLQVTPTWQSAPYPA